MAQRLFLCTLFLLIAALGRAQSVPKDIGAFLNQNCLDCHEGSEGEGGFDVSALPAIDEPGAMERWARLYDRVVDGEMPPADYGELDEAELNHFKKTAGNWLRKTQAESFASTGRVQARRLTNVQLERTLHDLLAIDIPLSNLMPDEQRTEGFVNIADGQPMSHFQMESHLTVVDAALDEAFRRAAEKEASEVEEFSARRLARENPRRRCRDPEMLDGKAVVWSSSMVFYGRITSTTVPESGWYRIRFSASAVNKPNDHGVWCTVRSGRCTSGAPLMSWIGAFEAMDDASEWTYEAWLPKNHMVEIRPGDETLKRGRFRGGQVGAGEGGPQNVPGVALHNMTITRIHPGGPVATVQKHLLGEMKFKRQRGELVCIDKDPAASVTKQLKRFARRAFRRPVSDEILKRYTDPVRRMIDDGGDPIAALRSGYRALLCSPRFMYFSETPGPLDDFAVASRLSYMIYGSMPDAELMRLAKQGRLVDAEVLRSQVRRMLETRRGKGFVKDLSAQWLDLVDIDFTEPDRKLHRNFDIVVQNAMLAETHTFLEELLDDNKSVSAIVDSDYTYLNSRLARFYNIDGVKGDALRKVAIDPKDHRGGLMAHGALLKVTANGTNTSPVLRGIWVSERILGVPIPPPPTNVPAVEPDIRGAKTIRQQLEKHLSDTQCANCHKKIDPPGFALENFDAAGRWRENYAAVSGGRIRKGPDIDPSNRLADGRTFTDFAEFRRLLAVDTTPIARNVAEKMLIYGTGAPITFADRHIIDQLVEKTAEQDYGMRSILEEVVCSPIFLSK